jgi:hypothetical protein
MREMGMMDASPPSAETEKGQRLLLDLLSVLTQKQRSGKPYSDDEIRGSFAWLLVTASRELPESAATLRAAAAAGRLFGLRPDDAPENVDAKIEAYYRAHPINPALATALSQLFRERAADTASAGRAEAARFMGEVPSSPPRRSERQAGEIAGGPMAQHQLRGKKRR